MLNKEKPVLLVLDKNKCSKCGTCLKVCTFLKSDEEGFPVARENDDSENLMGCTQCGSCMMLCPKDAIEIKGEDIDNDHLRKLSNKLPDYDSVNALFLKRRSCRKFTEQEVPKEIIEKILQSAATAAVSIPPSEVKVLVIQGREKVQEFADDLIIPMESFVNSMSPTVMAIGEFFGRYIKPHKFKMFKDFIIPLCKELVEKRKSGVDYLFYDAPAVIVFYGTELTDKEDSILAANQATLAAEALGLGTCIIGTVPAMLQNDAKLRRKYGFLKNENVGMAFILGYPAIKYRKAFQRNFKQVRFI